MKDFSKPRRRWFHYVLATLLLIIVGFIGAAWVAVKIPHAEFTTEPLSFSEFRDQFPEAKLDLPASVTRILYAQSYVGVRGFVRMCRFDAPSPDCIAYGKGLLQRCKQSAKDRREREAVATDLVPLTTSPPPMDRQSLSDSGLEKVDWFDVDTVRSGFLGRESHGGNGTFWIDTDRGRFYYFWAD